MHEVARNTSRPLIGRRDCPHGAAQLRHRARKTRQSGGLNSGFSMMQAAPGRENQRVKHAPSRQLEQIPDAHTTIEDGGAAQASTSNCAPELVTRRVDSVEVSLVNDIAVYSQPPSLFNAVASAAPACYGTRLTCEPALASHTQNEKVECRRGTAPRCATPARKRLRISTGTVAEARTGVQRAGLRSWRGSARTR